MKASRMNVCIRNLFLTLILGGSVVSGLAQEQNLEELYKKYAEVRKTLFDGTFDTKRNGPNVFLKSVEELAESDEEKAFVLVLYAGLASVAELEAAVSIEQRTDESNAEFIDRQDSIRSTIIGDALNQLDKSFSKLNIPNNSYLKILHHRWMIQLANADSSVDHQKLPPNVFAHCDALMNSVIFQENSDLIEPPFKLVDIWEPSGISGKRWQQYLIRSVRSYLCNYRVAEYFVEKKKNGLFTDLQDVNKTLEEERKLKEDIREIHDMQNQLLLAKYPLSDYPFLKDLLVGMDD